MASYNATIELALPATDLTPQAGDDLIERFIDWHPAIGVSSLGRAELIITLSAETISQATNTVSALTTGLDVTRIEVESTDDFDRRSMAEVPALLSVSEVAEALGVTRAAIQKKITSGAIPAVRVGTTWAVQPMGENASGSHETGN